MSNTYRKAQLDKLKLDEPTEYPLGIKLFSEHGKTHQMTVTKDEMQRIEAILLSDPID